MRETARAKELRSLKTGYCFEIKRMQDEVLDNLIELARVYRAE